ncbi:hypothetical protein [Mesorhizobium sp. B1-1-5]|uniref:hypothetical protein n=1 Tax=Mesorhizobium sp. B1-1-5 TaxID=2589979 RepID=UPI00112DBB2B|nr:hypothetical protein [Mesorhizobium sp. B1-1-5]TPO03191.1 hypothetical protein FJ980_16970 [Mesorhizobium sp. B1-1-5]
MALHMGAFRIILTAAASDLGETHGKPSARPQKQQPLPEKLGFVEEPRSTSQCFRNFSGYIAPQLSGRSCASPIAAN